MYVMYINIYSVLLFKYFVVRTPLLKICGRYSIFQTKIYVEVYEKL